MFVPSIFVHPVAGLSVRAILFLILLNILFPILLAVTLVADANAHFLPRPDDVRLTRMNYSNSSGEEGLTILHYRRDGVLGSEVWMLRDHSRHSANYYIYDTAGLAVEKYREFSDALTSTETFAYDEAGRRLQETFARSDGIAGTATYQWDEEGRLLTADCNEYKGWFSGHIAYEHEGERLTGATMTRENQTIGNIDYTYNHAGHLITEVWDFGGKWSQTFSYEYEPIPKRVFGASSPLMIMNTRFVVTGEDYDYNSEGGGPSRYDYGDEGRLEKKVYQRADGLTTETTFTFDDLGNLVTSDRVYHDGRTADFSYTYDDALRLTGKTFQRSDGQQGFEAYSYDRLGRLGKAVYRNMDFWLNGTITFAYDCWGYLDGGHFAGEDDFDAELEIETDSYGNVLTVAWAFSFDKTQTYTFKYGRVAAGQD